ncbi:hypothetical protein [Saccharicrinis sp. FJH54]|uniref:hypothetical protein n=1 Tax=Saccharicrinis sp. FJH54 TaxID=3344665 RepID=UPI0035D43500
MFPIRRFENNRYYAYTGIIIILISILLVITYRRDTFYDWTKLRPEIKDTVLAIKKDYEFEFNLNYPKNKISKDLIRRRWLMENATSSELDHLLNYPDGKIIVTAFQGLLLKNDTNILGKLEYVLNDTTEFIWTPIAITPVGLYTVKYILGLDSLLYEGPPPPPSQYSIIDYNKKFTASEINFIDSLITKIDFENYTRFEKYYDHR